MGPTMLYLRCNDTEILNLNIYAQILPPSNLAEHTWMGFANSSNTGLCNPIYRQIDANHEHLKREKSRKIDLPTQKNRWNL